MSNYPGKIDTDATIPSVFDNITEIGGDAINGLKSAVIAIERSVGINPQGSTSSLAIRINNAIDESGNIKATALQAHGLVTLPITNSQISDNAQIAESKLNLDFSTAEINNVVQQNSDDIAIIKSDQSGIFSTLTGHTSGTTLRHTGKDIDMVEPFFGQDNVEDALGLATSLLGDHILEGGHLADNILMTIEGQQSIIDYVDEASEEAQNNLLTDKQNIIQNSIAIPALTDNYYNSYLSTANLTVYETDVSVDGTNNILVILPPNASRITGKTIDFEKLRGGSCSTIKIWAGGTQRGAIEIDFSSALPTTSIDDIVSAINYELMLRHYPALAFNTHGKLTIAHTMCGSEYCITIQEASLNSAHEALGFTDFIDIESCSANDNGIYIDGMLLSEFKTLISEYISDISGDTIGNIDLSNLPALPSNKILANITEHSDDSKDGTYYITEITSNSITLNQDVSGNFKLEIIANAINFDPTASANIYDVVLKSEDLKLIVSTKHKVNYVTLNDGGISIKQINHAFPTGTFSWTVSEFLDEVYFLNGQHVSIPRGFCGNLAVNTEDGIGQAVFNIDGLISGGTCTITSYSTDITSQEFLVGSIHHAGSFGLKELRHIVDKRVIGSDKTIDLSANIIPDQSSNTTAADLRNNGVVYGLEYVTHSTNNITISGGRAYIDGKRFDIPKTTLFITDFNAPGYIILLNTNGNYIIKASDAPGYSYAELNNGDSCGDHLGIAPILEFETNGSAFSGDFTDRRLVIKNLDKTVINGIRDLSSRISTVESNLEGSLWANTILNKNGECGNITIDNASGFLQEDGYGFGGDDTTYFIFTDSNLKHNSSFKSLATNYINIALELVYSDETQVPYKYFGTSGDVSIYCGANIEVGGTNYRAYGLVKRINNLFLSDNYTERYIVSMPISDFILTSHVFMNITPILKITGSNYVDGGNGGGEAPKLIVNDVRAMLSSYNIAKTINGGITNDTQTSIVSNIL